MKRCVPVLLAVLVSAFLFLNVWQSFRSWEIRREILELERIQVEIFQKNKLALAGISYLNSPSLIDDVARETLGLQKAEAGQAIHVRIDRSGSVK